MLCEEGVLGGGEEVLGSSVTRTSRPVNTGVIEIADGDCVGFGGADQLGQLAVVGGVFFNRLVGGFMWAVYEV